MSKQFLKSAQTMGIELYKMKEEAKLTDLSFVCHKNEFLFDVIDAHQAIFSTLSAELKILFEIAKQKQPYEKVIVILDSVNKNVMEKLVQFIYTGEVKVNGTEKQELEQVCKLLKLNISIAIDTQPAIEVVEPSHEICNATPSFHWTQQLHEISHQDLHTHWTQTSHEFACLVKSEPSAPNNENVSISLPTNVSKTSKWASRKLPMNCKFCGITISGNKFRLQYHILRVHDNIKSFNCERCSYSTVSKYDLKMHNNGVHDKIKNFDCDKCSFSSLWKSKLERHIDAVHEKKKPYSCNKCEFKTARKDDLKNHYLNCRKSKSACS